MLQLSWRLIKKDIKWFEELYLSSCNATVLFQGCDSERSYYMMFNGREAARLQNTRRNESHGRVCVLLIMAKVNILLFSCMLCDFNNAIFIQGVKKH